MYHAHGGHDTIVMVLCLFVNCHAKSGQDKGVSFFRIPAQVSNQGDFAEQLSIEWRMKWISAISRADLTENILINDRVCSCHFIS